ncbi:MAG: hypothetical protein A2Z99_00855 [Treponema sp. GWB1_62_6]|nr:MAG: hypothetical protein A2Z99_00855 [Treponema sp. GWB1_62_6]OHE67100.1 MAG: hypothetical protein A2Y36_00120 [Treponema sp. GWA1_62_8]OHE69302.1 MAG: hypothetical protein A2001_12510 [Treponema sp. GWC1_61_84]
MNEMIGTGPEKPHLAAARLLALLMLCFPAAFAAGGSVDSASTSAEVEATALDDFADPSELWGRGVESALEAAFRECFKTYIIGGKIMTLRMPFGENNERAELAEAELEIRGGGKADPDLLWTEIDLLLETDDFRAYVDMLSDGREKVVAFDMTTRSWTTTRDLFHVARMKAGSYQGLPHRPLVLSLGKGVASTDVYNYLYCVGALGMDCSGFVWHALSTVADMGGLDLGKALGRSLRAPRSANASLYVGTWYFDSKRKELLTVKDEIRNLRPADVLLFRGSDGSAAHSAIIQSIDRTTGVIRYLQSTDEAPLEERGVHESFIRFDPAQPQTSLKDPSLVWSQKRLSPFSGERASEFTDDGARFRAFSEFGGGKVVRLSALAKPIEKIRTSAR